MENNNNNDNFKLQGREEGYTGQTDIKKAKIKKIIRITGGTIGACAIVAWILSHHLKLQ